MSIYRPEDFGRKYTQPKGQKKAFRPGIVLDPKRAKKGTLKKDFFDFNRLKTKRNNKEMISLLQQKDSGGTPYVTIGGKRRYFRSQNSNNGSPITMKKDVFRGPRNSSIPRGQEEKFEPVEIRKMERKPKGFTDEMKREAMRRRLTRGRKAL